MEKKVLVIDDSALMRRVISDIINEDEQLTVEDTAMNGEFALKKLLQGKRYDIILVDIKMPKMDGVQFLRQMSKYRIQIPTLVVSSIADESAKETIRALELGAFDFVKKPAGPVGDAFVSFRKELLVLVYCACRLGTPSLATKSEEPPKREEPARRPAIQPKRSPIVVPRVVTGRGGVLTVIASSTGGPKALQSVVPLFPSDYPYPIVVVQHMPKGFTFSLAERLDEMSPLKVKEAEDGELLQRGYVYIAQGGKQCELVQKDSKTYRFSENDKPARAGLRPCADIFLESLFHTSFDEILCGVLTGMGADASQGIKQLKEYKNVKVVAQNQETCVVYGMPRAAKLAGVVDDMVPLEEVAGTMMKKIGV